jgi:hypothetical protein
MGCGNEAEIKANLKTLFASPAKVRDKREALRYLYAIVKITKSPLKLDKKMYRATLRIC